MTAATRTALDGLARPRGRMASAIGGLLALAVALTALAAAAWLARGGVVRTPWWVPAAWVAAVAGASACALLAIRRVRAAGPTAIALRLEREGHWRRGALTGVLDTPAAGVSGDLLTLADQARADELAVRGAVALAPFDAALRTERRLGIGLLLLAVLGLLGAGPTRAPVHLLWHPAGALALALGDVSIAASARAVDRGAGVTLTIRAPGRAHATLWRREPGEGWRPVELALDASGEARLTTDGLTSDLFAHATSGGRSSDTLRIEVRVPPFLGAAAVTAHYPAYLGLEEEPVAFGPDSLLLPEGTRLSVEGEATADLASAEWAGPRDTVRLEVDGHSFRGRIVPDASGAYRLIVTTTSGVALGGDDAALAIRMVPDAAPEVAIPVPGEDTLAPLGLRIPLVVDARDDHGLTHVTVVSRRISRLGVADAERREVVALPEGAPDRVMAPFLLDLEQRALLPGDTVRYYAEAVDNAPRPRVARSRDYVLRLPTMAEVRAAERAASESVGQQLDSLAAESRRLQRQTEDLSREAQRPGEGAATRGEQSLSFEAAKRAEAVARQQEALIRQAEETREAIDALQRAAEQSGMDDPEVQRRLQEVAEQLDRALTPELREQLQALQEALRDLDAARTQQALEQLAEAQRQLKEALERSQTLFDRAALEGDLANLAAEARDLAQAQQEWADQMSRMDSARAAAEQAALAERADSLAAGLDQAASEAAAKQSEAAGERMEATAAQADSAAGAMDAAAKAASQGQRQAARQQAQKAAGQLSKVSQELDQQRESMQEEWRQEVVDAIDRMMAETSRLADRQLAITEALRSGEAPANFRAQQAAVEAGVEQLTEQYRKAAGEHALVPPQIGTTLEAARRQMADARDALSTAAPGERTAVVRAGEAVDALNAAAYQMLRARGDVQGAGSGSGVQEALERMAQLAQQQGAVGQQGAQLLPMLGAGGAQEQLRQLSAQQRALADQLERLRAETQSAGTAELAEEARDLARQLEAGRLDRRTVERQEQLYRRMLDAGRTLQGEERDDQKERQSTTATGDSVRLPPALRARLDDGRGALRIPTWEQLQQLSPEDRRLVLEYFRRLAEGAPR